MRVANTKFDSILIKIIAAAVILLLVLMPLHGLISVYGGYLSGKMVIVQSWKELASFIIVVCWGVLILKKRSLIIKLDSINIVAFLLIILSLFISIVFRVEAKSFLFGLKTNLEPLVLFLGAQVVASSYFDSEKVTNLIIYPAIVVTILALFQIFIPPSFLSSLGYTPATINPIQLVDPVLKAIRVFSTLGGPNQLGAYLILPAVLMLVVAIKKRLYIMFLPFGLSLVAIYLTYSRSSWIGFIAALILAIALLLKAKARYIFLGTLALIIVAGLVFIKINSTNSLFGGRTQYYLLHGRIFENRIEGSDQNRFSAVQNGINLIRSNPLGRGLGSAGPASLHSDKVLITENWYLQIAIEIGVMGLVLFISFFILNLKELYIKYKKTNVVLYLGLFAALIGLAITNLFLHSFADSSLSIIVFTSLGLARGLKR